MKTAKTCIPKLWQQRSNYVNRQPIKTAKTCTPNRYAGFPTLFNPVDVDMMITDILIETPEISTLF